MRLIVAGGRNYEFTQEDLGLLDEVHERENVTELVNGGAKGADLWGRAWALNNGIPIKTFEANWDLYGRSAGPKRNKQMARYADAVALFPGGRGTESMFQEATLSGIIIYDWREWSGNGTKS